MNNANVCAKCACTLALPGLPVCKNGHHLCQQCHELYSHVDRFACPRCGGAASFPGKDAELRSLDGGYQESTINMDQESRNSMEIGKHRASMPSREAGADIPSESCTPGGCIRGLVLAMLVWTSTVLNCLYYFSRTNMISEEVAVLLLFMLACQYYQYYYAQIPQLIGSPLLRVKALLKHLLFFPFVIEGQASHISKMFALKELVLAITVIAIQMSNEFVWQGLAITTLVFNIIQFILVSLYTFRPLNPTVEGMAQFLVDKPCLRKTLAVLVGLGNHCYFFLALAVSLWIHAGLFALNLMWIIFLLIGLAIHRCRTKTMTRWFALSLPYLYVDAASKNLLCEPYIRAVFFLVRYALTPVLFGYVSYDILVYWSDYIAYFGCTSDANCLLGVTVLNTIIAGFAMSLFSLLEIPIGCMLVSE